MEGRDLVFTGVGARKPGKLPKTKRSFCFHWRCELWKTSTVADISPPVNNGIASGSGISCPKWCWGGSGTWADIRPWLGQTVAVYGAYLWNLGIIITSIIHAHTPMISIDFWGLYCQAPSSTSVAPSNHNVKVPVIGYLNWFSKINVLNWTHLNKLLFL